MLKNTKVIIVGSGVNASLPKTIPADVKIIAVNHGWMHVPTTFDIWFPSNDFDGKEPTLLPHQLKVERYIKEIKRFGGFDQCGYQVVLNAIYWSAAQRASAIGLVGCDMIYDPINGKTHVYGIGKDVAAGEPDPIRAERVHGKSMQELYTRAATFIPLYNLSSTKKSKLPLPKLAATKFFKP